MANKSPFFITQEDKIFRSREMDLEAFGAYIILSMEYWYRDGQLTNDDSGLSRIVGLSVSKWKKLKPQISKYFVDSCDRVINKELDERMEKLKTRPDKWQWTRIRAKVFERDNYTCQYCGDQNTALECDHIYPASLGGLAIESNLITACKSCNRKKGNKIIANRNY